MTQVVFQGIESEWTHDSSRSSGIDSDRLMTQVAFQGIDSESAHGSSGSTGIDSNRLMTQAKTFDSESTHDLTLSRAHFCSCGTNIRSINSTNTSLWFKLSCKHTVECFLPLWLIVFEIIAYKVQILSISEKYGSSPLIAVSKRRTLYQSWELFGSDPLFFLLSSTTLSFEMRRGGGGLKPLYVRDMKKAVLGGVFNRFGKIKSHMS